MSERKKLAIIDHSSKLEATTWQVVIKFREQDV